MKLITVVTVAGALTMGVLQFTSENSVLGSLGWFLMVVWVLVANQYESMLVAYTTLVSDAEVSLQAHRDTLTETIKNFETQIAIAKEEK